MSELAHRERSAFKPIFSMNRWWARRSSAVFRSMLLGAALPPGIDLEDEFYSNAQQRHPTLNEQVVLDPFMGGGTTVVEALRLGFRTIGVDLNPLAWFIVYNEITPVDEAELLTAYGRLEEAIRPLVEELYSTECPCCGRQAELMHSFWAKRAVCTHPECTDRVILYRDLVVGRRRGQVKLDVAEHECSSCGNRTVVTSVPLTLAPHRPISAGEQVTCVACGCKETLTSTARFQEQAVDVFAVLCPSCGGIHSVLGEPPSQVHCPTCGETSATRPGRVRGSAFVCARGHENGLTDSAQVNGAPLPFHYYALEGHCSSCAESPAADIGADGPCPRCGPVGHRFFLRPSPRDLARVDTAAQTWAAQREQLPWPREEIHNYEKTNRLVIHGYRYWHQLFNDRQLLLLSRMLAAIREEHNPAVRMALTSAFLGTLEHQNMFNIYYVPYAQSAGAFGRHDFHPKRIEDFLAVQSDDNGAIAPEPVMRLQESVGIDDDARATFAARLSDVQSNAHPGAVLLGLIVGLSAAQRDGDQRR